MFVDSNNRFRRPLLRIGVSPFLYATVLCVVVPIFFEFSLIGPSGLREDGSIWIFKVIGYAVAIVSGLRLSSLLKFTPWGMARISFYIFIYIWCGLAPIYQISTGSMPWGVNPSDEYYYAAYGLIFLSMLSFEFGAMLFRRAGGRSGEHLGINRVGIYIFCAVALAMAVWLGPLTTPLSSLIGYREDVANALGDGYGRLVKGSLMRVPIYVAFISLLWTIRSGWGVRRVSDYLLLLLVGVVFLLVNFPSAISRAWLGATGVSIGLVILITSRRFTGRLFPALLIGAFLVLYPLMHRFRRQSLHAGDSAGLDSVFTAYTTGDFDVFVMTAHFARFIDLAPNAVSHGWQALGSLFFWMPRAVWPEKPVGSGYLIAEGLGLPFYNVSAPLWGEGLVNFGIPGVAIFLSLLGWFSRRIDTPPATHRGRDFSFNGLVYVFFAGFMTLLVRGDLMTAAGIAYPFLASCALLYLCNRLGRRMSWKAH